MAGVAKDRAARAMLSAILAVGLTAAAACGPQRDGLPGALVLSPSKASASTTMEITAPGYGEHGYSVIEVDTTAFPAGGTLDVDVRVADDSATAASVDLHAPGTALATQGIPTTSADHAYNMAAGSGARLTYQFARGERMRVAAEGNWSGDKGSRGRLHVTATVRLPAVGKSASGG